VFFANPVAVSASWAAKNPRTPRVLGSGDAARAPAAVAPGAPGTALQPHGAGHPVQRRPLVGRLCHGGRCFGYCSPSPGSRSASTPAHVEIDADETSGILDEWARRDLGIELEIVPAPYREPGGPVKARVEELRRGTHAVVSVVVPSLALRWWQRLLYTNSTRALRTALAGTGTTALIECRLPLAIAEPVPERIRSSPR